LSKGQFYQVIFLIVLCLLALPGFYQAVEEELSDRPTGVETDQKISLGPRLQEAIPGTRIDLNTTSHRDKEIIRHQRKIDINNANREELQELDGVGPATAGRIISYRETHGEFSRKEELKDIPGIGEIIFANLKNDIRISSYPYEHIRRHDPKGKKININRANQEELQSLSGIGTTTAQRIIEYREEEGRFTAVEELANVPGIGEVTLGNIKNQVTVR